MRRPPLAELIAWAGLAGVVAALSARRLGDFDLPWHLANGRTIVRTRSIPRVDDLAFTARPIEYTEFLSDALLYGVMKAGGPLALQITTALLVGGMALVLHRSSRRFGVFSWVAVALTLAAINPWILARPATVALLFTALLLAAIDRHRREPESLGGRCALHASVVLLLVWPNVHASAILGVALLFAYAAYRAACHVSRGRLGAVLPSHGGVQWSQTAAAAVAGALVSTLNTAGVDLMLGPLRAQSDFEMIEEWRAPTWEFLFVTEPATGVLLVVAVAALALGRSDGSRVADAFDIGLVAMAMALGATSVRLIAFGAILTTAVIAKRLASFVRDTPALSAACASAIVVLAPLFLVRSYTSLGVGFEPTHFPEGAVRFVERRHPTGRLWNFMPFGGYLGWRLYPAHRVLIDGRSGFVHDPVLARRAHRSNFETETFETLVTELDLQWAVTRSSEGEPFGLPLAKSPDWVMVFFDDVGAVYVRAEGPNRHLALEGYRVFRHLMPLEVAVKSAVAGQRAADWSHDGQLAARQAPSSPRARVIETCGAIAMRERRRFDAAIASLERVAPGHPASNLLRAAFAAATGTRPEPDR